MNVRSSYCLWSFCLLLTGCSESGSSNNFNGDQPLPSVPNTTVTLQIASAEMQIVSSSGDALPISFEGSWNATNLGSNSVYVRLVDESGSYVKSATADVLQSEVFKLHTSLSPEAPVGVYRPTISFVACKDSDCTSIYEDSKVTIELQLVIEPVPEWQTHQGNNYHNGYVPIFIDGNEFEQLWEWTRGPSSEPIGGINAPVAGDGEVYVSTDVYFGDAFVIALDELTGAENWRVPFGNTPALNPPAINSDTLFVATSGHEDTKLWAIDRADGKLKFQANFSSQWGRYLAPTVDRELVIQTGGYYGGDTYAFSIDTGKLVWSQAEGTSWGMDTAAIDDAHVYVHSGSELSVFDKDSGDIVSTITDPLGDSDYDYHGSPVKGSANNVLAFSGGAFSGRASSNVEHYDDRPISNFDIERNVYDWSSEFSYKTFFAVANGVVYAGKNNPVALDAIDERTGEILWSWVAPSTEDTSFHRNVVVTRNVLFVSTNAHLYAIDLESRESVWSYEEPGMIAISENRILLLAPGHIESDGRLIAFDLRSR